MSPRPFRAPNREAYCLKVTDSQGRSAVLGCGTKGEEVADAIAGFVSMLRAQRRWDILDALVAKKIKLPLLWDAAVLNRMEHFVAKALEPIPEGPGTIPPELLEETKRSAKSPFGTYVYAIRNATNGSIKIGMARRPEERRITLAIAHSDKLELIGCTPGSRELESAAHRAFADHRINGEWFKPHPDLMAWIEKCLKTI